MSNFSKEGFKVFNDYMTPKKAWADIQHLLPRDKTIWEAFYGNGQSGTFLTELGFTTVHGNYDFFTSDLGDIIVSNPPFSKIKEVLARMFELDKPFVLLMPSSKINTQYFREWKEKGVQIVIPPKRINFDKLVNGSIEMSNSGCNFDCFYYCYKMNLEKDVNWLSDAEENALEEPVAKKMKRTPTSAISDLAIGSEETSPCGVYRYSLRREWDNTKQDLLWVMLNPSSATGKSNDPTMRRCIDFAIDNGYGSMTVVNLFAFRSTDPSFLSHKKSGLDVTELVGNPQTDLKLEQYVRGCGGLCIAWGKLSTKLFRQRASSVMNDLLRLQGTLGFEISCLGQNLDGQPKHPLYIRKGTKFKPYDPTLGRTLAEKKIDTLVTDAREGERGETLSEQEREEAWSERELHDTWCHR